MPKPQAQQMPKTSISKRPTLLLPASPSGQSIAFEATEQPSFLPRAKQGCPGYFLSLCKRPLRTRCWGTAIDSGPRFSGCTENESRGGAGRSPTGDRRGGALSGTTSGVVPEIAVIRRAQRPRKNVDNASGKQRPDAAEARDDAPRLRVPILLAGQTKRLLLWPPLWRGVPLPSSRYTHEDKKYVMARDCGPPSSCP